MQSLDTYRSEFLIFLEKTYTAKEPKNLYAPIHYIMQLGGKRIRPVLTLATTELFGADYQEALPAAMALEIFHNFSLVHDDIMDDAPLRRGKPTVHEKWNVNTGILSGDAMLINSYQFLEAYHGEVLNALLVLFNKTAIEVCEGQQYDVDFETRSDVTIPEYLRMIEYKTSVLIATALKMGAIIAKTSQKNQDLMYEFGKNLGIAFQLQDDYLDAFGNPDTFGKQLGGDIIENKKTFLYLKALEFSSEPDRRSLEQWYGHTRWDKDEKIRAVKSIFETSGAVGAIKDEIEKYTDLAFGALQQLGAPEQRKAFFLGFGKQLMQRDS